MVQSDELCATNTVQQRNSPITDNQCLRMGPRWWNRKISSLPLPRHASNTSFFCVCVRHINRQPFANGSPAHWREDSAPVLVRACEFGHLFTFIYLSSVALMHC